MIWNRIRGKAEQLKIKAAICLMPLLPTSKKMT